MKVSTLLNHFSDSVLKKAVKAIVLMTEDDQVVEMTTMNDEGLDTMRYNNKKVADWYMTSTTLYIYIK